MADGRRSPPRSALLLGAALLFGAALALLARDGGSGPEPVPYDRVACAECGMLVSEPRFAAQFRPERGETRFFDDPGCLLRWRAGHPEVAGRSFFRHHRRERWLAEEEVAFARIREPTPMGYGLAAVARGEAADALSPGEALAALAGAPRPGREGP